MKRLLVSIRLIIVTVRCFLQGTIRIFECYPENTLLKYFLLSIKRQVDMKLIIIRFLVNSCLAVLTVFFQLSDVFSIKHNYVKRYIGFEARLYSIIGVKTFRKYWNFIHGPPINRTKQALVA